MNHQESISIELIKNVQKWATARNIPKGCTAADQALKLNSENGELSDNIVKGAPLRPTSPDAKNIRDDIGDNIVVMIVNSLQTGVNFQQTYEMALHHFNSAFSNYSFTGSHSQKIKHYAQYNHSLARYILDVVFQKEQQVIEINLYRAILDLICISSTFGIQHSECLQASYDEIKDRKGIMFQGAFVKESDQRYEEIIKAFEEAYE